MKNHACLLAAAVCLAVLVLAAAAPPAEPVSLEEGFRNPPVEARPATYYLLLNGYANRDYLPREIERLHDAGIGGLCVFDMGARGKNAPPAGPAFMSPESVANIALILRTAKRLGMEVDLSVSSSWDMGGSWVTPRDGSMALYRSEIEVEGPRTFDQRLPFPDTPPSNPKGPDGLPVFHTEVAVLAVPQPRRLPGHEFVFELEEPATIERVVLYNTLSGEQGVNYFTKEFSVEVSTTDARPGSFREVLRASLEGRTGPQEFRFPPARARYVRLLVRSGHNPESGRVQLAEFEAYTAEGRNVLLSHRANRTIDGAKLIRYSSTGGNDRAAWSAYNLFDGVTSGARGSWSSNGPPPLVIPDRSRLIDLTDRVDRTGRLRWKVPAGKWAILRFVCTNTGERLKVPSPNSDGLATDHLSAGATRRFLGTLMSRLERGIGELDASALDDLYLASYEVRGRIWTPDFIEQFQRRRGYDPTRFLPALYGAVVDDEDITERFRYDFRKTLGELLVDAYYRTATAVAHEAGVGIESEAGGPGPPIHQVPVDALLALGAIDSVRGEFWPHRPHADSLWVVKETAAAAHIYGKRRVHQEAFTSMHHWEDAPQSLKWSADRAMCEGANHFVWHTASHQPPEAGKPGWAYGAGTHLGPNLVWWPMAGAFLEYLGRASFLLQQGLFVADVVYYYGDQGFNFVPPKHVDPSLGPGYDYDVTNAEVILKRMSVREGKIVLPDGMSYEVLVLPERDDIDLHVLRKVRQLVLDGATVVGRRRPSRSTGLTGYPESDREVQKLAAELWGKGKIITDKSLREVLTARGVGPDFTFRSKRRDTELDYIHRRTKEAEIYFVRNKKRRPEHVEATFRVWGKRPELWDPVTGRIAAVRTFKSSAEGLTVPLDLDPHGSVFVVFREAGGPAPEPRSSKKEAPVVMELAGPWELRFPPGMGTPATVRLPELISWTEHELSSVRCFSGIATYTKRFHLSADWLAGDGPVYLELGDLWAVAGVTLNGEPLGVAWTPPFRLLASQALREGENTLEIRVANTWANRLIGEARGECAPKITRTNITATAGIPWARVKPRKSGLFGPVRLVR